MTKDSHNLRTPLYKRVFLINRDFQLPYVRMAVCLGLGSTVLTSVVILYPLFQFQILRFPDFLPSPFLVAMAGAALLNLVTIAAFSVLITHRIAGPMFSLGRHFRVIRESNRFGSDLKIRQTDDMKFVVNDVNQLLSHMRELMKQDLEKIQRLRTLQEGADYLDAMRMTSDVEIELQSRLLAAPKKLT